MASRSRGHKVKSDICESGILRRLPTQALVKARWEALYNESLYEMGFTELNPAKQCVAILFAKTFCSIADIWDCRNVVKEDEIAEKLASMNDLDALTTLLFKCFDKLNTNNPGKEKTPETKKEEPTDIGVALQQLLTNGDRPTRDN